MRVSLAFAPATSGHAFLPFAILPQNRQRFVDNFPKVRRRARRCGYTEDIAKSVEGVTPCTMWE
ncbi:hypothetical protein COLSTE_00874 [Collinsella stercoris DSM 13279]|uniref:Uncharacterized protein n=1 Tax=Collinsella stercoris DSM 13279 TaxID=445975 RepID=B6G9Y2_9ACTN|nr:hypothetical protein COLSTE_00874 [Collinsella stercoris DSM 13279]